MEKYSKRLWLSMAVIIFLGISFLTYFCVAKSNEPNSVVIEQKTNTTKTIGPEVYLCEITDFYETLIIILSTMIFVILGLVFFYSMRISRSQAEEIVMETIEKKSFDGRLKIMIDERFIESKNKGDIAGILEGLEEMDERINLLEEWINIQSYGKLSDKEKDEAANGDN